MPISPIKLGESTFGFTNFRNFVILKKFPSSSSPKIQNTFCKKNRNRFKLGFNIKISVSPRNRSHLRFQVTMQNRNDTVKCESEIAASVSEAKGEECGDCYGGDVMEESSCFQGDGNEEEATKVPYVGDKEPLSSLSAEYRSGSPILLEKIKILDNQYIAIRRTRGDGNCFFRSFMFSYLEHILKSQDRSEVDRIKANVEKCRKTLQNLGYTDFTFEDFFALFLEQLDDILQGSDESISYEELVNRSRDQSVSDFIVMFFRFVTAGEIRTRAEFFEPFITGLSNTTVDQFCKSSVEPMGEESDHIHITALSDALGVAIRVVYLDRSSFDNGSVTVNHHDFVPVGTSDQKKKLLLLL